MRIIDNIRKFRIAWTQSSRDIMMVCVGVILAAFLVHPTVLQFAFLAISVEIARRVKTEQAMFVESIASMGCRCKELRDLNGEPRADDAVCLSCMAREITHGNNITVNSRGL
jgi:hypothetical protein